MHSATTTLTIRVLLFAVFRETLGDRQIELAAPVGSTPEDIFRLLEERRPDMSALRPYTTFAVNREVVSADTVLKDGDELALLQPASGGRND